MSSFSGNSHAQRSPVIDYERQFQEDLERAQALSLESLALEKFRLQKQLTTGTEVRDRREVSSENANSANSDTDGAAPIEKCVKIEVPF